MKEGREKMNNDDKYNTKKISSKETDYLTRFAIKNNASSVFKDIDSFLFFLQYDENGNKRNKKLILHDVIFQSNLSKRQICLRMATDTTTLTDWYSFEKNTTPSKEKLCRLCIVLHLPPKISMFILNLYGYCFGESEKDRIFDYLINTYYLQPFSEINKFLTENGYENWKKI